ncbi:MAG: hypothetical protein KIT18_06115 [Burkholderiales bacterium]|nr:hypothetical protein [Burkholderiales bacterium]
MRISETVAEHEGLKAAFRTADAELSCWERRIAADERLPLAAAVDGAIALVRGLLLACIVADGKKRIPKTSDDILDVFKALVKGEPSWHAIRDNCRELVYYRNCINMHREDALPAASEKMAVRTARHIYLYVMTRLAQEGRLKD